MGFQVSPGVNVSEIDLSTVVPATSSTEGAIAGVFRWGPTNERVLVSSEVDLVRRFGKPHNKNTSTVSNPDDVKSEKVVFSDFSMPTAGTADSDTYTLSVGSQTFSTAAAEYTTTVDVAAAIQAQIVANDFTYLFNVGTDADTGDITLTYVSDNDQLDITYALTYNGTGTGGSDSIAPVIEQGVAPIVTQAQWSNVETFWSAADFLSYSDALYVVRVSDGVKATGPNGTPIDGIEAKYPGELGNSIGVQIIDTAGTLFDYAPSAGNFHIIVVDDAVGTWTGTPNGVLETFQDVSKTSGSKRADGSNNYIIDVLENGSRYINATSVTSLNTTIGIVSLTGGLDGSDESSISTGLIQLGWDQFKNPEEVDVSLLIAGKARGLSTGAYTTLSNYITGIAETRKDCIALLSPARELVVGIADTDVIMNGLVEDVNSVANVATRSNYAVWDTGYKYRYDKYNDQYIYTPLNGDIAGLCVRTDDQRDPWFSPAGYQRGQVKNVVKLAFNPSQTQRDQLYKRNINPVITQVGAGTLLFGDKTFANIASAFDRINVRRLFIVLEKAIAKASKSMLFEFNDEFTRAQFRNMVEPFLRDVQGRRGIYDFKVVADESNNTPEVIDTNRFVGDIYIKPARSINFIQLNFVAVRTGVEFSEIVGSA